MRLIDADALVHDLIHNRSFYPVCVRRAIEAAPTIEAKPVVHREWKAVPSSDMVTGKAYECSECRKMRFGSFKPNFCPNCGADMRGET